MTVIIDSTEQAILDAETANAYETTVEAVRAARRETVCTKLFSRLDERGMRGVWLPNVRISRAKAGSRNAGALYLKSQFGDYFGKITPNGELRTVVALAPIVKDEMRQFAVRGAEYLAEVGRETGQCCFCGLELTDPDSVARGYGPVCARKYGLDHPNRNGF